MSDANVLPDGWEKWTSDEREAWEGACGELAHHEAQTAKLQAAGAAMLASPAIVLAAKRAEVATAKRAAERAERVAKGAVAWVQARALHGDLVVRIDGEEGDVIIMCTPDAQAIRDVNNQCDGIMEGYRSALKPGATDAERLNAERRALIDAHGAITDALLKHTTVGGLDAQASTKRLREQIERYAGLRPMLIATRDRLILGWRDAEGKGFAPS